MKFLIAMVLAIGATLINVYVIYKGRTTTGITLEQKKNLRVVSMTLIIIAVVVSSFGQYFGL